MPADRPEICCSSSLAAEHQAGVTEEVLLTRKELEEQLLGLDQDQGRDLTNDIWSLLRYTYTHACTHARIQAHAHIQAHACACSHAHMRTRTYAHAHIREHAHMRTHAYARTQVSEWWSPRRTYTGPGRLACAAYAGPKLAGWPLKDSEVSGILRHGAAGLCLRHATFPGPTGATRRVHLLHHAGAYE